MSRLINLLLLSSVISVTTGCASLGLGEDDYACKGYPGHPNCMSAREVYKATNYRDSLYEKKSIKDKSGKSEEYISENYDDDYDEDDDEYYEEEPQTYKKKTDDYRSTPNYKSKIRGIKASLNTSNNMLVSNAPMIPRMKGAMPVRTNAQVMRIWVAPWEDKDGDLHAPGIVYKEIAGRRWNFGEAQYRSTRYMSPLTTGYRKPELAAGE